MWNGQLEPRIIFNQTQRNTFHTSDIGGGVTTHLSYKPFASPWDLKWNSSLFLVECHHSRSQAIPDLIHFLTTLNSAGLYDTDLLTTLVSWPHNWLIFKYFRCAFRINFPTLRYIAKSLKNNSQANTFRFKCGRKWRWQKHLLET